ncbi:uncharacterized protein L969DRAFT_22176 [Mixia osmundae IAM 14324]|uniref:Saccharopine dehydrogenase [NADP(+), L-glutamate-forming] n=1 Tax=Mixia osmundae (strain CBS 9802 / IAM 14324 / JCM 22182 / KY 12970) TaxID=764103 RepID=G7DYG3_MIXOS|nr:uncharacterized protein L969DRAFT_22176 [Mixia osmundae IAM 14324]KEI41525.1 hypothetical protein L969DRAFT_22176 [Mixia osmundae IAM 14324]GAA95623.1 hypothetical protein E5Q_02279 [Mixia osmundae IAM 14324]
MAELSHPGIVDGWFHERSSQWPGQAMSLQVEKVLHVEKSKFQDVLVFKSTDYGNVLVLDGAIQATERDEFSYQEMIAFLPLASHPDPQDVLVVGGGDGGVLREVLKHPSVKRAILVDIDEAVPRVSKLYLPGMAAGFNDPRVEVIIGDGFEYLKNNKAKFDVITTDSSDPVGPANSLFQKPYFELLRDSLKPGGAISTQAECIWLHLPLISQLVQDTKTLFPVVEYAYTSIPTYPSGTIGFIVCSLDPKRDLRSPLVTIRDTRYWNPTVHRASFVLPEFVRKPVEAAKVAKKTASSSSGSKKILLLGSGFVAQPAADYVLRRPENSLTIACRNVKTAQALAAQLSREAKAISLDVSDAAALEAAVAEHDLVISLIPYTFHAAVIKAAIKAKKNVVTTSYVSDAMKELEADAKKAGIVVMNEIGLDPGIDHLYAVKTIDEVHRAGGKITGFLSYCGGLPAPEAADNPLGYKFSWSSRGVLLALLNSAKLYSEGKLVEIDGQELMQHAAPYFISPAFAFVCYPNRDSTGFREKYNIPEAGTVIRGTLRYQGFPQFIKTLVNIGFLSSDSKDYLQKGASISWNEVTAKTIGASGSTDAALAEKIVQLAQFPNKAEEERILGGLRWLGLLSSDTVIPRENLLDTLCATLEQKMQYEQGERDMVCLQHKFYVENKDGSKETRTSTLLDFGVPYGTSSMAKLVGVPCGIAVQQVLDGVIKTPGILAPYSMDIVTPLLEAVEAEGITMIEKVI